MKKAIFERVYVEAEKENFETVWGDRPETVLVKAVRYIRGKYVLDLGVGEGKDAVYLAKKGFSVLGIDNSELALKRLKNFIEKSNIKLKTKLCSIEDFEFSKKYDTVISLSALNFLKKKDISTTIKKIKENTKKGGINVLQVFNTDDYHYNIKPHKWIFFKKGELKNLYKNWDILFYREYMGTLQKHTNTSWHRHGITEIIARKP